MATEQGSKIYDGVYQESDYLGWKIYMGVNRDDEC